MMHTLGGVIPALITPFDQDENIDYKRLDKIIDFLLSSGVDGLYVAGSTGEGFLMTDEERKELANFVVDKVKKKVPVIVHVGAISTKRSIDLAVHAQKIGADAISSVPPFYWRFDEEHIVQYYRDISNACSLPMIVYNVPLVGLMSIDLIKKLANIEGVIGIKYTSTDHFEIRKIKEAIGHDFLVFSGSDEMAVSGLLHGSDGLIGSFYSMIPDIFLEIKQSVDSKDYDYALFLQKVSVEIIDACLKYDYYAAIKQSLTWMGIDAGYVRSPFLNLSSEDKKCLIHDLKIIADKYDQVDCALFKAIHEEEIMKLNDFYLSPSGYEG